MDNKLSLNQFYKLPIYSRAWRKAAGKVEKSGQPYDILFAAVFPENKGNVRFYFRNGQYQDFCAGKSAPKREGTTSLGDIAYAVLGQMDSVFFSLATFGFHDKPDKVRRQHAVCVQDFPIQNIEKVLEEAPPTLLYEEDGKGTAFWITDENIADDVKKSVPQRRAIGGFKEDLEDGGNVYGYAGTTLAVTAVLTNILEGDLSLVKPNPKVRLPKGKPVMDYGIIYGRKMLAEQVMSLGDEFSQNFSGKDKVRGTVSDCAFKDYGLHGFVKKEHAGFISECTLTGYKKKKRNVQLRFHMPKEAEEKYSECAGKYDAAKKAAVAKTLNEAYEILLKTYKKKELKKVCADRRILSPSDLAGAVLSDLEYSFPGALASRQKQDAVPFNHAFIKKAANNEKKEKGIMTMGQRGNAMLKDLLKIRHDICGNENLYLFILGNCEYVRNAFNLDKVKEKLKKYNRMLERPLKGEMLESILENIKTKGWFNYGNRRIAKEFPQILMLENTNLLYKEEDLFRKEKMDKHEEYARRAAQRKEKRHEEKKKKLIKVLQLYLGGMSFKKISEKTGYNRRTVSKWIHGMENVLSDEEMRSPVKAVNKIRSTDLSEILN